LLKLDIPPATDEGKLVQQAIRHDSEAFAALYDLHVVRVYRHIYYIINDQKEAEDLTAQTFLQAWEAIGRFRPRGAPFASWLLRIAHNLAVSHLRARKGDTQLHESLVDDGLPGNPEAVAERQAEGERVRRAVLRLGDDQRQVIMLRFIEELDYREVAEILGKSVAAVRVIQHRALCALRKIMKVEEVA
jgi:RNA polymerase sigma-70 factor (ECF subfamily)